MIGPMIFVGVGGSGGNTVRAIRETLRSDLKNRGWQGEFPECWQTLWIDTIADQGRGGFPSPMLPQSSYLGLVPGTAGFTDIKTKIIAGSPENSRQEVLAGWMPESSPVPISKGAGQFRAIGRTIGVSQFASMKSFLDSAINRMNSNKGREDLARLNQLFGHEVTGSSGTPTAFIISSMAGGSGSGLYQDVAHMLKLVDGAYDNFSHVLLYGADVFALNVPKNMMLSIPGNTLGALAETLNGIWRNAVSPQTDALFTKAGFNATQIRRYGGKHHWLIGAKSNNASLGSTNNEIYAAVGSSLAALAQSPATLEWLNDYVLTNVFAGSASGSQDMTGLKIASNLDHYQPFAAMGFSRITLGMDRFKLFAAEAITKQAVHKMLWPDFEPLDSNTEMNAAQKVDVRADQLWVDFLSQSGLKERNPDNDVIDALKPQDDLRISKFANETVERAAARDSSLAASVWEQRIMDLFQAGKKDLAADQLGEVAKRAKVWTEDIQDKVLGVTASVIGSDGYRVASKLLKKLRDEVDYLVAVELPADSLKSRNLVDEVRGRISGALNSGKAKLTKSDPEVAENARKFLVKGATFISDSDRIDLAIELLDDLNKNFLAPLQQSLDMAAEKLKTSLRSASSTGNDGEGSIDFSSFPLLSDGTIPARFAPPNTEQSLIDYKTFPSLLEDWSKQVLPSELQSTWKTRLVERVIKGTNYDPTGDDEQQSLIQVQPRWSPLNSLCRANGGSARSAEFSFITDIMDIFDRATHMLTYNSGTLSDSINMGLRTYIEDVANPATKNERRDSFKVALGAALAYCSPMVTENATLLDIIHPAIGDSKTGGRYTFFSTIPLENSPLEQQSREIIKKFDSENTGVDRPGAFNNSSSIKEIEFYSTLTNARNPVVFDSLMDPISSDWNARANNLSSRQSFWTLRRTKPLVEAVPIAQENLQKLVTGWFALAFTGGRQIDNSDVNRGPKISVYSLDNQKWVDFPHPLLALPTDYEDHDYLPAVLQSLSIALLKVNEHKNLDSLLPYQTLLKAGSNDRTSGYKVLLQNYLMGKVPGQPMQPVDRDDATEKLKTRITKSIDAFQKTFEAIASSRDPFTTPAIYEVRDMVMEALTTVRAGISVMPNLESGLEDVVLG